MKKQLNRRERLKLCSIAFMKAMKPKINRSGKPKDAEKQRSSTILLRKTNEKLSHYPGTV